MGELAEKLGGKDAGQLIRHSDWNALVEVVDDLQVNLVAQVEKMAEKLGLVTEVQEKLLATVEEQSQRLAKLETRFEPVEKTLETFRRDYQKLTLQTDKLRCPIGDWATIEARVTGLDGEALDLSDADARPWVDFVASWGLVKGAPGFLSRGGVGDRTISVRVNEDGVAAIRVRAEHGEGISDEEENDVKGALTTRMTDNNFTVERAIMESNTPMEAKELGAFRILRAEYDRDAPSLRRYVDAGYLRFSPKRFRGSFFRPAVRWRDYRSTVLAFVKADGDPTTADHGRGVSSMQVVFRDWISPFAELDYFKELEKPTKEFKGFLEADIVKGFQPSFNNLKKRIADQTKGKGWLGRQRNMKVAMLALDQLKPVEAPEHLDVLKRSVSDAVTMQLSLEAIQPEVVSDEREVALDVFANTSLRADIGAEATAKEVAGINQEFAAIQKDFQNIRKLETEVLKFDVRDQLNILRDEVLRNVNKVDGINAKVVELDVRSDVIKLRKDLNTVDEKVGVFNRDVLNLNTSIAGLTLEAKAAKDGADKISAKQTTMEGQIIDLKKINVGEVNTQVGMIPALVNRLNLLEQNR